MNVGLLNQWLKLEYAGRPRIGVARESIAYFTLARNCGVEVLPRHRLNSSALYVLCGVLYVYCLINLRMMLPSPPSPPVTSPV